MSAAREVNFDGLVGPTHNYSGLSFGNLASSKHKSQIANPREAALQGLEKMKQLSDLGLVQGVLPPQERPDILTLRRLGFSGSEAQILKKAYSQAPHLLAACCSASSMWAANAATVSPSADCRDARVHFTVANLQSHFHRSLEADTTAAILKHCFPDPKHFAHHPPLPSSPQLGDEGAANHNRLCNDFGHPGIEIFVYGQSAFASSDQPQIYPARQSEEACRAIARNHQLAPKRTLFVQQNPAVIDQGVFHNDVIAVANANVLFCHQHAFVRQQDLYQQLHSLLDDSLQIIEVANEEVDVASAVQSYLFNSQLLTLDNNEMVLLVPGECQQNNQVAQYLEKLVAGNNPIQEVLISDLRQSMQNGGGPACLRLRIVLTEEELVACNPSQLMDQRLYDNLRKWIIEHYRDRLTPEDLADPQLMDESYTALDELTRLLDLGSLYHFQQTN